MVSARGAFRDSHPGPRMSRVSQVVGRAELLEMLSNYDYTIDYTSDADGAAETFGGEAGYGIISASKMLAWVEENCAAACPGEFLVLAGSLYNRPCSCLNIRILVANGRSRSRAMVLSDSKALHESLSIIIVHHP